MVKDDYPDESTFALVEAVSHYSGLSEETVLVEFGKYWVNNTGKECYPSLYSLAGGNARQFLLNMNKIHRQVTRNIHNAKPPTFFLRTTR